MRVRQLVRCSERAAAAAFSRHHTFSSVQANTAQNAKHDPNVISSLLKSATAAFLTTTAATACCDAAPSPKSNSDEITPFATIDSGASISIVSSQPRNPLLQLVAIADPQAIHTLGQRINDSSQHSALLDDHAVFALANGLSAARSIGPSTRPVQLAILRLMADLAEHNPTHSQFSNTTVSEAITPVLADVVQRTVEPWLYWIARKLALLPSHSIPSILQPPRSTDDLLTQLGPNVMPPDLDEGIAYHTLRCIANISRQSHLQRYILKTPILEHLCRLLIHLQQISTLSDSERSFDFSDILRFTTVSVSALAKSAPKDVVIHGAHQPLINLMTQHEDTILQSYAAGGIRNLSRHFPSNLEDSWYVHRELVISNLSKALEAGMDTRSSTHTRVFSVLTFSDVMTTRHPKAHLIRGRLKPAYQSYANLMKDANTLIFRAMGRSLTMLFDNNENKQPNVDISNMALVIGEECGPFIAAAFKRNDMMALRAVRSMCLNQALAQRLVGKGVPEYLMSGLSKTSSEYAKECTAALACLSEWPEHRSLLSQRGALQAVLRRPCLEGDGQWASAFLANMARDEEYQVDIAHSGLRVFLTSIASKKDEAVREGARGLYNLSLGGVSKVMLGIGDSLVLLVKAMSSSDSEARRFALGALAEVSEAPERAMKLVEAGLVGELLKCAKDGLNMDRDVARCLAQLSQVNDAHGILVQNGAATWLADIIAKNGGCGEDTDEVMHYATIAVCNIAFSPGIARNVLLEKGIIGILAALSSSHGGSLQIAHNSRQALHNLRGKDNPVLLRADRTSRSAQAA